MIFVARYKDGTCGIAEAANESEARTLLESEAALFDPNHDKILSVRPLSGPFVSRWYFEGKNSKELCEIARLDGMLSHEVMDEIYEHEYPMISAAYRTAEDEEPLSPPNADRTKPILADRAQLEQLGKWGRNLTHRVRQAVEIEIKRFEKG